MGWRDYARKVHGAGDNRDNRDNRDDTRPNGSIVPIVPNVPPLDPVRAMRGARAGLASIDPSAPLHGLSKGRWTRLLEDAAWLLEGYAGSAFRDGWTIGELFGLWWWRDRDMLVLKEGWGGVADRLQGARSLKMTADRACWRRPLTGEPDQFNRTAYPHLKPLWEQN